MKTKIISITILSIFLALFQACDKTTNDIVEPDVNEQAIVDDDAADIVAKELSESTAQYGCTAVVNDGSDITMNSTLAKILNSNSTLDTNGDTTLHFSSSIPPYNYDFTASFGYNFVFNGVSYPSYHPLADTVLLSYTGEGSFSAIYYSGTRTASTSEFIISGLKASSSELYCKIKYNSETEFTALEAVPYTLTSIGDLDIESIVIDKASGLIKSGNGTYQLTLTTDKNISKTFTIIVNYIGNEEAEITFNGKTYTVDLAEGEVI